MNNKEILTNVTSARLNHLLWRLHIESEHSGKKFKDFTVEVSEKDCEFGKWFYNEGNTIKHLGYYDKIETLHKKTHEQYSIYLDTIKDNKGSFLKNVFKSKTKIENEKGKLNEIFNNIINISHRLVSELKQLEKLLDLLVKSDNIAIEKKNSTDIKSISLELDLEETVNVDKNEKVDTKEVDNKEVDNKEVDNKKKIKKKKPTSILSTQDEINRILGIK